MSDHQPDHQPGDRSDHRPGDAIGGRTGTRARGLINDGDPRVVAVERQLGPELVEPLPPERLRYLAALAVAVCDEHGDRGRSARRGERTGLGERTRPAHSERSRATRALAGVLAGVILLLLLVLAVSVVAAVAAAVLALWRAVL
ncbi:hypothetical protein [Streptomyces radiopugnans]|uniref:Uncharacterized protein n=1 Tax=Streptomyces radiopugnans TaxID=403935 RepID=A0A1H9E137_9ACTN|nr:hypothetical protein [Streptomyces radiopugnans]SEQ19411.1 hypothetical protein SAMN05216481_104393 [Streptomyces radiopugnans]